MRNWWTRSEELMNGMRDEVRNRDVCILYDINYENETFEDLFLKDMLHCYPTILYANIFSVLINCLKIYGVFILTTSKFQNLMISNCRNFECKSGAYRLIYSHAHLSIGKPV